MARKKDIYCTCISHGCGRTPGGVLRDSRTVDGHALDDSKLVEAGRQRREQALKEQEDRILQEIGSMVISEQPQAGSSRAGGRMWGSSSDIPPPRSSAHTSTCERQQLVDKGLEDLRSIEEDFLVVSRLSSGRLDLGLSPSYSSDPCPFAIFHEQLSSVHRKLKNYHSNLAEIQAAKIELDERVVIDIQRLKEEKIAWATAAKLCPPAPDDSTNNNNTTAKSGPPTFDTSTHFDPILEKVNPTVQLTLFMVVAMHVILRTVRRGCVWMFEMTAHILFVTLGWPNGELSPAHQKLLADMPHDPDTAVKAFHLESKHTFYAVCPAHHCHFNHEAKYKPGSSIPHYPAYCEHQEFTDGPICATRLTRPRTYVDSKTDKAVTIQVPIKTFIGFCMKDHIAGLVSSLGKENRMDSSNKRRSKDESMADAIDGEYLRNFKGPDKKTLFSDGGDEGRYLWSMSVDFCNPQGNKQGGKKTSIGVISLVCLSLPPEERYKPENMFLYGIIPGPKEPPLTTMNHFFTGLIDVLLELWDGVFFSRTAKFETGRLIRSALILVVCDLPAARKVAGMASFAHEHFCSVCHCTRSKHGYGNLDSESWKWRTDEEIRKTSAKYQAAPDSHAQDVVFNSSGVRWSELSRLPYFDMSKCIVVDSMHNLFLGLIKEHTNILGISLPKNKTSTPQELAISLPIPDPPPDLLSETEVTSFHKLRSYLEGFLSSEIQLNREAVALQLKKSHLKALDYVGRALRCDPGVTPEKVMKKDYWIDKLIVWRARQVELATDPDFEGAPAGFVLTRDERDEIWSDLRDMVTPSWLTAIPHNLGESTGKLKADQYRVLGTTYLPISLIRLWSHSNGDDARSKRRRKILDVTISLVSAIAIATSRKTSVGLADEYFRHMKAYIQGLKDLFPDYKFKSNHHMALHLREFLVLFGPVHAWWTFPFERVIGMLQRIPTNGKIGELEGTIALSYNRAANLRLLLSKSCCPASIRKIQDMFNRFTNARPRGTLTTDMLSFIQARATDTTADDEQRHDPELSGWNDRTSVSVPSVMRDPLRRYLQSLPNKIQNMTHITLDGITFSVFSKHGGNSSVMVECEDGELPARIEHIVQIQVPNGAARTLFAVSNYLPWLGASDPFQRYPFVRAKLWQREVGKLYFVDAAALTSHFARLDVHFDQKDAAVIISLSRVMDLRILDSNAE